MPDAFFLTAVFFIESPFVFAGRSHADNADGFLPVDGEDHGNHASNADANGTGPITVAAENDGMIEEPLVQISEIHPVLDEVGGALRLVPDDFHILFCTYIIIRCQHLAFHRFDFAGRP